MKRVNSTSIGSLLLFVVLSRTAYSLPPIQEIVHPAVSNNDFTRPLLGNSILATSSEMGTRISIAASLCVIVVVLAAGGVLVRQLGRLRYELWEHKRFIAVMISAAVRWIRSRPGSASHL